ncbi:PorT protein [Flavobacterium sp. 316]|uniref:PorT family protein n=1 Tax=Flavobacterium sediminilitoris TaxID=2024526 RepID=A0ABY4HRD8_9FLAO|nr:MULTISPECIES: porin family protein [Flavobacterium]KIX21791.1 PorT protein [Flavobacterium sp. 316]UOX35457.1 PorT family protein [Flavobacterium sediminilitoris]
MKKNIILFLITTTLGYAQGGLFGKDPIINLENFDKQKIHWGYYLGFNSLDYKFDYLSPTKDIESETTIGFNVGLVGNLRLMEYIDLRFEPGLNITQRNLIYPNIEDPVDRLREVKSTYIHFPLLLKFSSKRTGNIRPYLLGGVSASLNLSSNSKAPDDNFNDRFRVKKWTNNYEIGFGIDLYLEYFKFSPSIRGVFSMNDELIRDNTPDSPWTGNIQEMKTRGIFINFTFH